MKFPSSELDPEIPAGTLVRAGQRLGLALFLLYAVLFASQHLAGATRAMVWRAERLQEIAFWVFAGWGVFKLAVDPRWAAIRPLLFQPRAWLAYAAYCLGTCALGLSVWLFDDPGRLSRLALSVPQEPRIYDALKSCLMFFLVFGHFSWSYSLRSHGRADPVAAVRALRRDAWILGIGIVGCLASVRLSLWGCGHSWPFFLWSTLWSLMVALKAGLDDKIVSPWTSFRDRRLLVALALVHVGAFSFLGIRKLDLGIGFGDFPVYLQPLWNTLHGKFMGINWCYAPPGQTICWFGEHLNLEFLALVPFHWLVRGNPRAYVVLQALTIALAAWPLYRIGMRLLERRCLAFALAFAWLLNPLVNRGLLFDFHSESLEPLLIFAAFLFLVESRYWRFLLASLALLCCKEDAALYVVAFGLYGWLFRKDGPIGRAGIVLGLFWLWFSVGLMIPIMRGHSAYHTLSARYPLLGSNLHEVVANVWHDPLMILRLMFDQQSLENLAYLALPLAALPLLHPAAWLLALPPCLEMFLSQFRFMKGLALHYPWFIVPFFFIGTAVALQWLLRQPRFQSLRLARGFAAYLCVFSLLFNWNYDPRPPVSKTPMGWYINRSPLGRYFSWAHYRLNDRDRRVRDFVRQRIPAETPLSAEFRFVHELSGRAVLRMFPQVADTDWVFADLHGITGPEIRRDAFDLLSGTVFGIHAYEDGLLLLERGADPSGNLMAAQDLVGFCEAGPRAKHAGGAARHDWLAFDKEAFLFTDADCAPGSFVEDGPHRFPQGPMELTFRVRLGAAGTNADARVCVLRLEAPDDPNFVLEKPLDRADFQADGRYRNFTVAFDNPRPQRLSARLVFAGCGDVRLDHFQWTCRSWTWEDLKGEFGI